MDRVTSDQIERLRDRFFSKPAAKNSADFDFCTKDLDRVKRDDVWLSRFLVQEEFDIENAAKHLVETCRWRKEFGANELTEKDIPTHLLNKGFMFIRNRDRLGHQLFMMRLARWTKGTEDINNMKKLIVFLLDRIERESKSGQVSTVADLENAGLSNIDMGFTRYMILTILPNYPLIFNQIIVYELPWILNPVWKIIKSLLPQKLAEAVKIAAKKDLHNYIDADNRLVDWGGNDDFSGKYEPEIVHVDVEPIDNEPTQILDANANLEPANSPNKLDERIQIVDNSSPEISEQTPENHLKIEETAPSTPEHNCPITDKDKDKAAVAEPSNDYLVTEMKTKDIAVALSNGHIPKVTKTSIKNLNLLQVPRRINFTKNKDGTTGIFARFQIKNVSTANQTLIFKINTTSPEKFHVRPTIGILKGGAVDSVVIKLELTPPFTQRSIEKDRFQIQGMAFDPSSIKREDLKNVGKIWREQSGNMESHLVTCCLDPAILIKNGGKSQNQNQTVKESNNYLTQIEKWMAEIKGQISGKHEFFEKVLYILLGVGIGYVFLLFSSPSNSVENCKEIGS